MTPVLSIVTGSMDRPASLARLIGGVRQRTAVSWELIIVDSSNEPPHRIMNENAGDERLRFVRDYPARGCTTAYNIGFEAARGEWVIWLNDDAEPLDGYDTNAIRYMETHPKIGLGALAYFDKRLPELDYHVSYWWRMVYANFGIIHREFGNQIGWFDTRLQMYGCDNSISCRVLLAGRGIAPINDARVLHHAINDTNRSKNAFGPQRMIDSRNFVRYYHAHIPAMQRTYQSALS